jgi:hypothetical protein
MQQKRSKNLPQLQLGHTFRMFPLRPPFLFFLLAGIAFRLSFVRLVQPSAVGTPPAILVIGCAEI